MRRIIWFVLAIGLLTLRTSLPAEAQETPRPLEVQVIIGADGSVKVVDPKTGKEIARTVINVQKKAETQETPKPKPADADKQRTEQRYKLLWELERSARSGDSDKKPEARADTVQIQRLQLQIDPNSKDGKAKIVLVQPGKPAPPASLDGTIDRLIKDLEELRREMKKPTDGPAKKPAPKNFPGAWKFGPGPGGMKPGFGGKPMFAGGPPAANVEKKLDLILKQMEEMRGDIKNLKDRLPTIKDKKGPGGIQFEFNPFSPPKGKDKEKRPPAPVEPRFKPSDSKPKPDEAALRQLEAERKQLQGAVNAERQKALDNLDKAQRAGAERSADLEARLQRLIQEVDALRQDVRKSNPAK